MGLYGRHVLPPLLDLVMRNPEMIPDAPRALGELRRVLVPGGRLLFVEHGRAPQAGVERLQRWLTPGWKRLAGGCRLDRKVDALLEEAGFRLEHLECFYLRGPRPMAFTYRGEAQPR